MSQAILEAPRYARRLQADTRGVLISANPRAGAESTLQHVADIRQALECRGFDVLVITQLSELETLAREWHAAGHLRAALAAGGDGTASAVRNFLPQDVPLLPLPCGTECLLARHVGQAADIDAVCRTVVDGWLVQVDVGRVGNRLFLLMVSAGLDAEVVHRLQACRTGHITHTAYVKPTLQAIRSYQYPEICVYCDGEPRPQYCRWFFGFNLPCYARGLQFAPNATGTDGLLDVCAFRRGRLWNGLRYLWHVTRGSHLRLPDVDIARGQKFRIESAHGGAVPVQVDGDIAGTLPVDVEVVSGGLTLLVPAAGAHRLGFELPEE